MKRSSIRALIISSVLALVVYAVVLLNGDRDAINHAFSRIDGVLWLSVLGLSLINYVLRYARWDFYLRQLQTVIPIKCNFTLYMAGFALTTSPGKVGEAMRSIYLKPFGMGYTASLSVLFVERLSDLIAVAVLAVLITTDISGYDVFPGLVLGGLVILLFLTFSKQVQRKLSSLISEQRLPRLHKLKQNLSNAVQVTRQLSRPSPLIIGLVLGLIAWGAEGYGLFLISNALDIPISPLTAAGIYAISVIIGALSFIPGGLGTTEASMGLLLIAMGASPADATVATLICRIATLWFAVVLGLISVMFIETGLWGPRCEPNS